MTDALRHDYIVPQDAPFLHDLGQRGARGSLIPSFGFEPDGAYFSGLDPEECDGGAQYWRNPNERLFYLTRLFAFLHRLPSSWWRKNLRRAMRLLTQLRADEAFLRKMATSGEIPFEMLAQFSMPMKKMAHEPGFMPSATVFDAIRAHGGRFYFHGYPAFKVDTDSVVRRYLREERGGNHLAFLFFGDLDGVGHRYGPDSIERRNKLKHLDAGLRQIYTHALAHYKNVDILVFGDHGMAKINRRIDLRQLISDAKLDRRNDAYFLDSTFARFWISDDVRRRRVAELLNQQDGGHVLSEAERTRYRIRYRHNYFGDIFYVADDHVLIHPSFYCTDRLSPKGMHGYLPGCRDNESAIVLHGEAPRNLGELGRIDMRRVFPTVLDLLGIMEATPIPHQMQSITP